MSRGGLLWSISFGDLLTLLVFFFVAGFSLQEPQYNPQPIEKTEKNGPIAQNTTESSQLQSGGTLLATLRSVERVKIPTRLVQSKEGELEDFVKFVLTPLLSDGNYLVRAVQITLCELPLDNASENKLTKAFSLASQIFDSIPVETEQQLVFDSRRCSEFQAPNVAGEIQFNYEQVSDG